MLTCIRYFCDLELLNNHDFMNFRTILVWLCNWYFIFVLMKLAGVVAVEVTGGPEIPFHPGRPVSEPFHCNCFADCIIFCRIMYD